MAAPVLKPHCFTRRAEGLPTISRDEGDAIRTAFFKLAEKLSEPDKDLRRAKTWWHDKLPEVVMRGQWGSYRKWVCTRLFFPAQAEALGQLYAAIEIGMAKAYMDGKADGAHLLSRLAKGEITVRDFDQTKAELRG